MRQKKKTVPVVLSVILIAGAFLYLIFSSFGETLIYYKTVDELLKERERFEGQAIRINGVLVAKSVKHKPGTKEFRFQVTKRGQILDVHYEGVLPDAMQEGRDLVVQGVLESGTDVFHATEILTKCPSKHEAKAQALGP